MNKNFEDDYPFIVQEVMKYINEIKATDNEISLVDIIMDFCFKNELEIELVGDAISSDVYFKSFIEKDCQMHRIFLTDSNELDNW